MSTRRLVLAVVVLCVAVRSTNAQTTAYEKVLFPVALGFTEKPGAYGSRWITEESVVNGSATPVTLFGNYSCWQCKQQADVEPGLTYTPVTVGSEFGWFLLVERGRSDDLSFELRIRDLSRASTEWGAELPVVREREFRTRSVELLDVPVNARYRVMVRVYSLRPADGAQVRVRTYRQRRPLYINMSHEPDQLLGERIFSLSKHPLSERSAEQYPSIAFLTELPIESPLAPEDISVRVEVTPVTEGVPVWAFATVTNNETQAVTIISPR